MTSKQAQELQQKALDRANEFLNENNFYRYFDMKAVSARLRSYAIYLLIKELKSDLQLN